MSDREVTLQTGMKGVAKHAAGQGAAPDLALRSGVTRVTD
ncbi:Hypothetical protein CAP_7619 [Chondromyces apiculatus DSM 436]|uniref:Uncharacterized protein n=1 Tax=Chondromyces apiculatus DSM 436 TaxID=1192034 RepID=A0A017T0D5_9BACT|nr:Hypothetical protein CAP_7619 [Chondromyces apiculatus DSM 436]